jgi:hypothetical protein
LIGGIAREFVSACRNLIHGCPVEIEELKHVEKGDPAVRGSKIGQVGGYVPMQVNVAG